MKNLIYVLCVCVAIVGISSCSATKSTIAKKKAPMGFVGNWNVTISNTPMGDIKGQLMIEKTEDTYSGFIVNAGNKIKLEELKIVDRKMTSSFYSAEYGIQVQLEADLEEGDNGFKGLVMNDFPFVGTRNSNPTTNQ